MKRTREMTHNMAAKIVAPMTEPKQENVVIFISPSSTEIVWILPALKNVHVFGA